VQLREALIALGVVGELRDNNTALLIRRSGGGMPVWMFVGYGGAYYSWQSAEKKHLVSDVDRAAKVACGVRGPLIATVVDSARIAGQIQPASVAVAGCLGS
jgi:hypothetical protein